MRAGSLTPAMARSSARSVPIPRVDQAAHETGPPGPPYGAEPFAARKPAHRPACCRAGSGPLWRASSSPRPRETGPGCPGAPRPPPRRDTGGHWLPGGRAPPRLGPEDPAPSGWPRIPRDRFASCDELASALYPLARASAQAAAPKIKDDPGGHDQRARKTSCSWRQLACCWR